MTEVMIGAVVVVVGHLTALAALWLRLNMQLQTEQLRREARTPSANRRGDRRQSRAIRYIVAEISTAVGLAHKSGACTGKPGTHPRTLRHTLSTQLLRNSIYIIIANPMRHTTLNTPRPYTNSRELQSDE